jgi:hypothetical protein
MLKRKPGYRLAAVRRTGEAAADKLTAAAAAAGAVSSIFTGPLGAALPGHKPDQRESATRRAHRLRIKELFARANAAS